jgi:hypothetical protein
MSVAEIRAELIARGLPVHKVDMLMDTQSPNVINGPFKTRDVDDSSER